MARVPRGHVMKDERYYHARKSVTEEEQNNNLLARYTVNTDCYC